MARQHSYETTPQVVYTHPEMFDANGQLVPDEILALRIETHDNTDEEDDDQETKSKEDGSSRSTSCY